MQSYIFFSDFMSTSEKDSKWNFRIVENLRVTVDTRNKKTRKISVQDFQTKLAFIMDAATAIELKEILPKRQYLFTVNVYTAKNLEDVDANFIPLFEGIDIDYETEDFIKALNAYATKVHFELVEFTEP